MKQVINGTSITPLDFASGIPLAIQYLEYIEGKKEQASGRFKYSTGDAPQKGRTATEAKITAIGQDATVAYEIDIINDGAIIPSFETIGETMANFQTDEIPLKYKDSTGKEGIGIVDDTVRQGNYVYMVGDNSGTLEKQANAEQFLQSLEKVSQLATSQGKQLSLTQVMNTIGAIYSVEKPSKFIEDIPQQPAPPTPQPNEIMADLANQTIIKAQIPDKEKMILAQAANLVGGNNEPAGMPTALPVDTNAGMEGNTSVLPPADIQQNMS